MRGFAHDIDPPSSRSSAKAQAADCRGQDRASRGSSQAHISPLFVHGCVDLGGLSAVFRRVVAVVSCLIAGVLNNEYLSYLIFAQVARFSDTLTTCIRTIQTC